jgi:AIG2-like family
LEGIVNTILYFAYGSNLSTQRLAARVPSARAVSVAMLRGHRLEFHKIGKDGSAKCDVASTGDSNDVVYGVVFAIPLSEKAMLDGIEGLGYGYAEKEVVVLSESGAAFEAVTYYATSIDASLKPVDWYVEHVLRGAREHGLPAEYISGIETIESTADPENYKKEMAIYLQ